MEILKEKEKENESNRSTRILLILNIIIWSLIIIMSIFFGGVVHAQTINMTNWAWKDTNDNWTFVSTGSSTSAVNATQISFNFNDASGNNNGTVYFETDVTGSISVSDISTTWWTNPNPSTTGTVSKNCTVTQVNYLTNHVRCQLNFTITNNSQNLNIILNLANARPLTNATASGSTDYQPTNNATTQDIVNQTIQITNQIVDSVRNSIQNVEDQSDNIIYQISNAINNAAESILNTSTYCETIDKNNIITDNSYLNGSGDIGPYNDMGITDYINIKNAKIKQILTQTTGSAYYCFYEKSKNLISCESSLNHGDGDITKPLDTYYMRFTIVKSQNRPQFEICKSDIQAMIDNQNKNTNLLNNSIVQQTLTITNEMGANFEAMTPDTQDFDDLEDVEDSLHTYTNVNLDSFDVDIDTDTNSWVWNTLTSLLNTSSLVFGMVISILSIGLIKLVLNR